MMCGQRMTKRNGGYQYNDNFRSTISNTKFTCFSIMGFEDYYNRTNMKNKGDDINGI